MANAIQFSFGFDLSQVAPGAQKLQAVTMRAMGRIKAGSAIAFGAAAGAAALAFNKIVSISEKTAGKVRAVFDVGSEVQVLSQRTGIAAGRVYQMGKAFRSVGVESDKLAPSIVRMQVKLSAAAGGSEMAAAEFQTLGLNFRSLLSQSPDQQFNRIAVAIAKIRDPTARGAAAVSIFGKAGAELLPLFNSAGALATMGGKLSSQAQVFQRNSAEFQKASMNLKRMGGLFNGFYVGMAGAVAARLNQIFASFNMPDFVAQGARVGSIIANVAGYALKLPNYLRAAAYFLTTGIAQSIGYAADLVNMLWAGLKAAGDVLAAGFHLSAMAFKSLAAEMIEVPIRMGIALQSGLKWAFQNVLQFFGNGFWDLIANISAGLQFALQQSFQKAVDVLPDRLKKVLGVSNLQSKTFAQFQAEAHQGLDHHKSGYKADSYAAIEAGVTATWQKAMPAVQGMVDALKRSAVESANKAKSAWDSANADPKDVAHAKDWHQTAEVLAGAAVAYMARANAPLARAASAAAVDLGRVGQGVGYSHVIGRGGALDMNPSAMAAVTGRKWTGALDAIVNGTSAAPFRNMTGLGTGGLKGGAYGGFGSVGTVGMIRSGSAAREAQAEQRMKAEQEKKKTVEGTNERLDKLIQSQEAVEDALT